MQYIDFKNDLNNAQYEAVTTNKQNVRIIAGAGSGKTRVLTYRIAYLISHLNVSPHRILAITFTNKVANEMKNRILDMIPINANQLMIKTFHSFAAYFLRHEIEIIGFPRSFTILDEEDQTKLIKDIAAEMGYKRSDKIVGKALNYIGYNKLKGKYPKDIYIVREAFENEKTCLDIYTRYEEEKDKFLSLDFDDLLLKTNYILNNYPLIRQKWSHRFEHILVDEFQDTNDIEFEMIDLLLNGDTGLYVVGDPDQTIYTWRGANQDIILELNNNFSDMYTITLEENYRSTQSILDSANKLIANNKERLEKNLFTRSTKGEPIVVHGSPTGKIEADYVAREIQQLVVGKKLYKYSDIAILYRSNYISLEFEAALVQKNIPYKIYGGQKFYQRREIKDVLAYFHLITNTKDDVSFERIINTPSRKIGDLTVFKIKSEAKAQNMSLYDYIKNVDVNDSEVPSKALNSLKTMIVLIEDTKEKIQANDEVFSKTLEDMIWTLNLPNYYMKEDDGEDRIENIKALFADIRHFLRENPESTFDEYLQNIALLSAQDDVVDGDFVTLMTVHTAKGLEYPVVFIVRLNNGVFPNSRALMDGGYKALEEERRLAYVAMTRAKKLLYLTYASDYSYVLSGNLLPSQFLEESGNAIKINHSPYVSQVTKKTSLFNDVNQVFDGGIKKPLFDDIPKDSIEWKVGDTLTHKKFGKGKVIELEGDGIIKINFESCGIKSVMGNHPALKKGE